MNSLDSQDMDFLMSFPLFLKFENITVLHGGLQNNYDLNDLTLSKKAKILRMRYLDKNHNFITYGKEDEDSVFWADLYNGNQCFVVYGHQ